MGIITIIFVIQIPTNKICWGTVTQVKEGGGGSQLAKLRKFFGKKNFFGVHKSHLLLLSFVY